VRAASRPTRTARAAAYLIDGGFAVGVLVQGVLVSVSAPQLFASVSSYGLEAGPTDIDGMIAHTARWFAVMAILMVLVELVQRGRWLAGGASIGLVVAGLELQPWAKRRAPWARRLPRTLPAMVAFIAASMICATHIGARPLSEIFDGMTVLLGVALGVTLLFAVTDAIIVLVNPERRTIADYLTRVHVVARQVTGAKVTRAFSVSSRIAFVSALLLTVSYVERVRAGSHHASTLFGVAAICASFGALVAWASSLAYTFGAFRARAGLRSFPPLVLALLTTLPYVSFFFLRKNVERLAVALPEAEGRRLRASVGLATAMTALSGTGMVLIGALPQTPSMGLTIMGIIALIGECAKGVALMRLSRLDYDNLLTSIKPGLAQVFA
jgi:hypothetical protein